MKQSILLLIGLILVNFLFPAWWWIQVLPFLWGIFFFRASGEAFWYGGLAGAIMWTGAAAWLWGNYGYYIVPRIANLLQLPYSGLLLLIVLVISFLSAGLAAAGGYFLRAIISPSTE